MQYPDENGRRWKTSNPVVPRMSVSPEEFFMYLTIGLIVLAPIGARVYRRMTLHRTQHMLREEFKAPAGRDGERP